MHRLLLERAAYGWMLRPREVDIGVSPKRSGQFEQGLANRHVPLARRASPFKLAGNRGAIRTLS